MPFPRSTIRALPSLRLISRTSRTSPLRTFTTSPITRSSSTTVPPSSSTSNSEAHSHSQEGAHGEEEHGHESHYDPPSGWLWGIKPGEKVEKEGWENVWIYGFFGSFVAVGIAWAFKPDSSIQTWALEEARRRLEVEGILKEPESK